MSTLEVLYAARKSLCEEPFYFANWGTCTCGHIYRGAMGHSVDADVTYLGMVEPAYADAIRTVAAALGWKGEETPAASAYVSDFTQHVTGIHICTGAVEREHALMVIDKAIAAIQMMEEANRLNVLAQTEHVHTERELIPA